MLSRVADHLYWMSRYLERAEHTARLIGMHLNFILDQSNGAAGQRRQLLLKSLHIVPKSPVSDDYDLVEVLTFNRTNPNALVSCIAAARENARQVREQISTEMWGQVNQLFLAVNATQMSRVWADQPYEFYQMVKNGSHLFQGITDSTMSHGQGWHFIQLGRFLERVMCVAQLLDAELQALAQDRYSPSTAAGQLALIGLLRSCTAFEAYSKVYTANVQRRQVVEFLLLNPEFPHSISFAIRAMQSALDGIATATDSHKGARVFRLAGRLRAQFDYSQIDEIIAAGLPSYLTDVRERCSQIHDAVYETCIDYPIEEKLAQ
jgi:uncharacterized alpha-E superfamily protein